MTKFHISEKYNFNITNFCLNFKEIKKIIKLSKINYLKLKSKKYQINQLLKNFNFKINKLLTELLIKKYF